MDAFLESLKDNPFAIVLLALALLVITAIAARSAKKFIHYLLTMGAGGTPMPKGSIIENIVVFIIWATGASLILAYCFKVDVDGVIAALGVGGIAVSLGFQDTLSNIFGGIQIVYLGILEVGDHVIIDSTEGLVENVTWRQTTMRDFDDIIHVIPNSVINSSSVQKYEANNLVATKIAFTNDDKRLEDKIREVELLAKDAVSKVAELERDPWVLTYEIGEYGTYATLRFVLKDMDHVREAQDATIRAITPCLRPQPEA